MRTKFNIATVQKDGHHMFTYEKGKKTPIPDDGVVFLYLDGYGLMHATQYADVAGSKTGTFLMTDEIEEQGGLPCINGKTYTIWGATDTYVYQTANKREGAESHFKEETKKTAKGNSVFVPHGDKKELAALELLADLYCELAE